MTRAHNVGREGHATTGLGDFAPLIRFGESGYFPNEKQTKRQSMAHAVPFQAMAPTNPRTVHMNADHHAGGEPDVSGSANKKPHNGSLSAVGAVRHNRWQR